MAIKFATYDDLRRFNHAMTVNEQRTVKAAASRDRYHKDTFLSHSSRDKEYLPGVIQLLESYGASVYCDLDDDRMPEDPSPETARIVKQQIKGSRRLVVFVTKNCKDSKWVPWELGVGDSELNPDNVALFPTAATSGDKSWALQEYMGLYRHIVWGDMEGQAGSIWMVYDHHNNTAIKLADWF